MKVKDMTLIAVMAAMLCIAGPLTVSAGPIPLSLASFAVYMAGAVLGAKRGTAAVALYLMLGIVGLPVFSGFGGGFQKLAGVTGGYLVGYLPCAFLTGIGAEHPAGRRFRWISPLLMIAGTAVLYLIGTAWFIMQTGQTPGAALTLCVLPFLPGDGIKIAAVTLLADPVRRAADLHSGKQENKTMASKL